MKTIRNIKEQHKQHYEDNKERILHRNKQYYQDNSKRINERITCDICGCQVNKRGMLRHQKSNKCIDFGKSIQS